MPKNIIFCLGCKVEIWSDNDSKGNHFTCFGYNYGNWCHMNGLGTVGYDEASTIKCTCPLDFGPIPANLVCPAAVLQSTIANSTELVQNEPNLFNSTELVQNLPNLFNHTELVPNVDSSNQKQALTDHERSVGAYDAKPTSVGAYDAKPTSWPWIARLHYDKSFLCSGTILGIFFFIRPPK